MREALKELDEEHLNFIYKECGISNKELFEMDEDALYDKVYDVMCDIEIAEIPVDDDEEESERCVLASDIVTVLGNTLRIPDEEGIIIDGTRAVLSTPLGLIDVMIDGKLISYEPIQIPCDQTCKDLNGRYSITIAFPADNQGHEISCTIRDYIESDKDEIETGERLELKSFYGIMCKLSIGMEGDGGYFPDGTRASDEYDYDNEYLPNGVKYIIFPETKTKKYVFGIAWIDNVNKDNDVQTWYGADPTMFPHLGKQNEEN